MYELGTVLWRGRNFAFSFPGRTLLVGVVNVTPDSFFDGGKFFDATAAVEHGLELVEEGADILDVGGESSRPGAAVVSEEEELRRIVPVVEALSSKVKAPISVDTMKPKVAERALAAGAAIVNDIAGNREGDAMWATVAAADAGYILMHMKGTPQTMNARAEYDDVAREVSEFFGERLLRLEQAGVKAEQVALDVGLGFAKKANHNLQLLASLPNLTKWKRPLLVGASRKSFIGQITGAKEPSARLPGSLACACWAVAAGANIIRTHDIAATKQAIRMTEAIWQQRE